MTATMASGAIVGAASGGIAGTFDSTDPSGAKGRTLQDNFADSCFVKDWCLVDELQKGFDEQGVEMEKLGYKEGKLKELKRQLSALQRYDVAITSELDELSELYSKFKLNQAKEALAYNVGLGALAGGVAGATGVGAHYGVAGAAGAATSSFVSGAVNGAVVGFSSSFVKSSIKNSFNKFYKKRNDSLNDILTETVKSAFIGGAFGVVSGAVSGAVWGGFSGDITQEHSNDSENLVKKLPIISSSIFEMPSPSIVVLYPSVGFIAKREFEEGFVKRTITEDGKVRIFAATANAGVSKDSSMSDLEESLKNSCDAMKNVGGTESAIAFYSETADTVVGNAVAKKTIGIMVDDRNSDVEANFTDSRSSNFYFKVSYKGDKNNEATLSMFDNQNMEVGYRGLSAADKNIFDSITINVESKSSGINQEIGLGGRKEDFNIAPFRITKISTDDRTEEFKAKEFKDLLDQKSSTNNRPTSLIGSASRVGHSAGR